MSGPDLRDDAVPGRGRRSLGEIVHDIAGDLSTLVHQELDLAKTEIKQEASRAGRGVGMLGGAGVAALLMPSSPRWR